MKSKTVDKFETHVEEINGHLFIYVPLSGKDLRHHCVLESMKRYHITVREIE